MEAGLSLLGDIDGGGGGSSGTSANESTVSYMEVEAELELGLELSLGGGNGKASSWGEYGRILTAQDFPSALSQSHRVNPNINAKASSGVVGAVSGTKRAADSVVHEGVSSPTASSQVVGWPPIRAYRINSLVNQAKAPRAEEERSNDNGEKDKSKDVLKKKICNGNNKVNNITGNEKGFTGFVKVNMDGIPIGRKVDLDAHGCYETLAQTLEDMFFRTPPAMNSIGGEKQQATKTSKLLDGSLDFVLTYEDKEGDWMLVGDVPWGMFLNSIKRLRIMKTSEANGLAPRFQQSNERQRSKPSSF